MPSERMGEKELPLTDQPIGTLSQQLTRRLKSAGVAINVVVPLVTFFGYMAVDQVWSHAELVTALVTLAVMTPVVTLAMTRIHTRLQRGVYTALDGLEAGRALPEKTLRHAQRSVFLAPWRAAASTLLIWCLLFPAILSLVFAFWLHTHGIESFVGGLVTGPLVAMFNLFTQELCLRPAVGVLFREGGLDHSHTVFDLSVRKRMTLVLFFIGPYVSMLMATLFMFRLTESHSVSEAVGRLTILLTFLGAISAGFLVFIVYTTKATISLPLTRLAQALYAVQQGELEVGLPIESNDDIGMVTDRFNHMVAGLRERERIREAFGRYVSPDLVQSALSGSLKLGGETREVSVLFSDVRNFTALSERLDPQALVEMMNRYFEVMVACIQAEGGLVNKFIGDGIMALFGAPTRMPEHAVSAVKAAIAMQAAMRDFNAEQRALGLSELAIGVGIATGPVVVGNIGSHDRLEYTAMGDTVNTASRIEGLNKESGSTILFDAATYEQVRATIPVVPRGSLNVKGKSEPIRVFAPLEASQADSGTAERPTALG